MDINKSSWHYRLLRRNSAWIDPKIPSNNLCTYFWQVVITLVSLVSYLFLAFALFVTFCVGVVVCLSPLSIPIYLLLYPESEPLGAYSLLGFVVFLVYVYELISRSRSITSKSNTPNIAIAYVKAKKAKVCPVITFKDK